MTQPVQEPSLTRTDNKLEFGARQLRRRPATPAPIPAVLFIKVFTDTKTVTTSPSFYQFEVSEDMDGMNLTRIEGYVTTVSSSGAIQVQLFNVTQSVDMLSTVLSIDAGELNSKDAATQPVIDTGNDDVAWGDHLQWQIDSAGTGAKGLGLMLTFELP